jgi:hypothetical protein
MLRGVFHLYLFLDEAVPRPQLLGEPLPQGAALLMGIYDTRAEAERRLEALQAQISEALDCGGPACGTAQKGLRDSG